MSIASKIEHLKSKPEHVRRRIAFWSSFGITAVIALFWVASYTTIGNSTNLAIAQAVDRVETPAESLIAGVGSFWDDVRGVFFRPKKVQYGTVEVVPGAN
jgi:hypothetical protein